MSAEATPKLSKQQIKNELWRRGDLTWKMHINQKEMYEVYKNAESNSTLVWLLARQSGKSYCLALIALMEAIQSPNSIIKLLTDTKLHVKTIFEPLFTEILDDCPDDLKPVYNPSMYLYRFPNGSQIQMAGSDGNSAERLRGQKSKLILVDEAGFCNNLNHNVMSILLPTTTHTKGKIILASTPSEDPDHDFVGFIEQADLDGKLTKKTIFDNPLLSPETIQGIIAKFPGGITNVQFRREYLCEILKNEERTVIPEATDELLAELVREYPKPPFYDSYVSMDIGWKDLTVVLFGYYDFRADKIVIEDEIVTNGLNLKLPKFTEDIIKKEEELWTDPITLEFRKPHYRVSDIEPIVTQEIWNHSGQRVYFNHIQKSKGYKLPTINNLRTFLSTKRIVINPRCQVLIRHLKNCKWKDKTEKDDFARSPDHGHYDAVDALIYMVKVMNFTRNPYPPGHDLRGDIFIRNKKPYNSSNSNSVAIFESIFGSKKRN